MFPFIRVLGLLLATAASVYVWYAPMYSGHMTSTSADGQRVEGDFQRRLPEVNGAARTLVVISVPVAIAIMPLIAVRLKIASAIVLLVLSFLGGMSIGLFYLPAALVLFVPERSRSNTVNGADAVSRRVL